MAEIAKMKDSVRPLEPATKCTGCNALSYQINHSKSAPRPIRRETEEDGQTERKRYLNKNVISKFVMRQKQKQILPDFAVNQEVQNDRQHKRTR